MPYYVLPSVQIATRGSHHFYAMPKMILNWEHPIYNLHAALEVDASSVSDTEVRSVVEQIDRALQTNCDSAAQYLFFSIASICQCKPHLENDLLLFALRPLYLLGIETGISAADWLKQFLVKDQPYVEIPESGRHWIHYAASNPILLQTVLAQIAAECE